MNLSSMAWRNIWRNRRRTLITLFGIAFGVMLAVLSTGIGDSSYGRMIDKAAIMGAGHVTVQHPDYLELPTATKTVARADKVVGIAKTFAGVEAVRVRQQGAVMLATARQSYGTHFLGIDPTVETPETLEAIDQITLGTFFESADDKGIILGSKLAKNLDLALGKRVVYTMTDKHGEVVSGLARVSGIVHTGAEGLDASLCWLPSATVQKLLGYADTEATLVAVFLSDNRDADRVADELGVELPPGAAALSWKQIQASLYGFIQMKVTSTIIFELIIMLLLAAGIFNSLFVSVMERLREFGIMLALGFSAAQIFGLVMWESIFIALTGLVAAVLVSAGPYYHLTTTGIDTESLGSGGAEVAGVGMDRFMYVEIYPENAVLIAAIVVIATLAAGLYPAWKAGRVEPVDAIKLV